MEAARHTTPTLPIERLVALALVVLIAGLFALIIPERSLFGTGPSAGPLPALDPGAASETPQAASGSPALAALLPSAPSDAFLTVPVGADQVGPIDTAALVARAKDPQAEQTLLDRIGYLGGYKKAWLDRTQTAAFGYIYEFATSVGANEYATVRLVALRQAGGAAFDPGRALSTGRALHLTVKTAAGDDQYQTRLLMRYGRRVIEMGIAATTPHTEDAVLTGWVSRYLARSQVGFQ